jgi:hypothetical protein
MTQLRCLWLHDKSHLCALCELYHHLMFFCTVTQGYKLQYYCEAADSRSVNGLSCYEVGHPEYPFQASGTSAVFRFKSCGDAACEKGKTSTRLMRSRLGLCQLRLRLELTT